MTLRTLFRTSKTWTQGAYARSRSERGVGVTSRSAVCWCLSGGLSKCYPDNVERQAARQRLEAVIRRQMGDSCASIVMFNDHPRTNITAIKRAVREARV